MCIVATILATSCSNPFAGDCISIGVYGVSAYVTDAGTKGAPSSTPSMRLVDGSYVEEYDKPEAFPGQTTFLAASERPGTYQVAIRAAGYQDYVRDNIVVRRETGGCRYLKPVRLDVALVKAN